MKLPSHEHLQFICPKVYITTARAAPNASNLLVRVGSATVVTEDDLFRRCRKTNITTVNTRRNTLPTVANTMATTSCVLEAVEESCINFLMCDSREEILSCEIF